MACAATPVTTAVVAGRGGYRDPRIADLPRCAYPSSRTSEWKIVVAPDREFAFRLPTDFAEVENPSGFIHGGKLWQRGKATVSLQYGHWGLESFAGAAEKCVSQVGDWETVVIRFQRESPSFVFWFVGSGPTGGHELIMGLNGERISDEALLLSVGQSVFRAEP